MTRSDDSSVSSASTVAARANTIANAERNENRTASGRGAEGIGPYSTDVADDASRSSDDVEPPTGPGSPRSIDVDPRSALPLALALATLMTTVWVVRSIPRTLSALAVAVLLALALNPLVEAVQRRTGWQRGPAVGAVLVNFTLALVLLTLLVVPPTLRQVRDFDDEIPKVVQNLDDIPIVGDDLERSNAEENVQEWLDELPERLSVNDKPISNAANTVADGVGMALLTILLAVTLLADGELFVNGVRTLVPPRRRARADRMGRLVYEVLGKYIAGSLLVAAVAGTVMLIASLALGVPLAPLVGVWVAMTNPIPQLGGALGGLVFVALGVTQGVGTGLACLAVFLVYQQLENHVIQPLIVGRAVHLSPPATMVAALVGVSAGGVIGALFAVPLLGAAKAIYLSTRPPTDTQAAATT
jgi:predicted PurR-regulated permease PerM